MKIRLFVKRMAALLAFTTLVGVGVSVQADYNTPQAEGEGVIQLLDFANSQMTVSGTQYSVPTTVNVAIAGSYGAFTMLEKGMKIEFTYLHYSDGARVMQEIAEVNEIEEY